MAGSDALPQLPTLRRDYACPDGSRVSETIHRARLAADDPACAGCPHANDTASRTLEFDRGNIRGRYLNTIDRGTVRSWCRAIAASLLSDSPAQPPKVVVGHDERSSSPDLAVSLRELAIAGCEVIDIGRTLRPLLDFAVRRVSADAGLLVTGGTRPAGWTGLDIVGRGARPWSWPGTAKEACSGATNRIGRRAGKLIGSRVDTYYIEDLRQTAHGLRPITTVVFCQSTAAVNIACELAAAWPGETHVDRISSTEIDNAANTLRQLRYRGFPAFDLAVFVSADGRQATVLDETGRVVEPASLAAGLAELSGGIVEHTSPDCGNPLPTEEELDQSTKGWLVGDDLFWGHDDRGYCRRDAFWVMGQLVQRLSISDLPASQVFRNQAD